MVLARGCQTSDEEVMAARISVVIPIYNGSEFLAATLESVLNQTLRDFEVICIDDGSTDQSAEVVSSFQDSRIRLLRQQNQGLCATVNRGISEAQTPFVARNDQDDLSDPTRLERQLAILEGNPEIGCLFTHYRKVGRKKVWSNADKQASTGNVRQFRGLVDGCQLASTIFARTELLRDVGGFRQEYYPADDWDLQLRLVETGRAYILEEPLVTYRFHLGANTYPLFAVMQSKGRWAEDSHRRRLEGQAERSFGEFQHSMAGSRGEQITRARTEFAKLQLRLAGQHYLDGEYVRATLRGFSSLLVDPVQIVQRVNNLRRQR